MSSSGAVYARVPATGVGALEAAIREVWARRNSPLGVLAFEPARHAFALVDRWGGRDDMPHWAEEPDLAAAEELAQLSRAVGEVVAFFEVEEGDAFALVGAWRDGALVRELLWAGESWQKVEGEPQPWEAPLFDAARRDARLQHARDYGQAEEPIRAAYARGRIAAGEAHPVPGGIAVPIRDVLRGPAYGFEPWPRRSDVVKELKAKK